MTFEYGLAKWLIDELENSGLLELSETSLSEPLEIYRIYGLLSHRIPISTKKHSFLFGEFFYIRYVRVA